MRVRKSDALDYIILIMMFLQLVILGFFGLNVIMNKIVTLLILIRIVNHAHAIPRSCVFISSALLFLFVASSATATGSRVTLVSNFLLIFYSMIYIFYGFYVCRFNPKIIVHTLKSVFILFNITLMINTIVMLIQIFIPYSIQAVVVTQEIKYYEDTICGLFAYGSTHVAGLYCISVMLFNLSFSKLLIPVKQIGIKLYTIVVVLVNCYISTKNDNKAFVILLLGFMALYITLDNRKIFYKRILCVAIISAIIITMFYSVLYKAYLTISDSAIVELLSEFISNFNAGTLSFGSYERIAILGYALKNSSTWRFGQGVAIGTFRQPGFFGFKHFGQSDMGSFILLLGIWFFILLVIWYMFCCMSIVKGSQHKNLPKIFVLAFFSMLLTLSLYTQCFSRTDISVCLLIISLSFNLKTKSILLG